MKKYIVFILVLVLLCCFTGCNKDISDITCYHCDMTISNKNSIYCPYCGSNLSSEIEENNTNDNMETVVDYSDFGFQNNYGMNEWMEIRSYNFEDKDNPYVLVSQSLNIKVFENNIDGNYYLERYFSTKLFEGNSSIGELRETLKYNIITNNLIEFQTINYPTWEISVVIDSGIPIIFEAKESYYDEPELVPTYFIDWSRELEGVIVNKEDGSQAFYNKYYIKSECIK